MKIMQLHCLCIHTFWQRSSGLPDHCIFGAKTLTMLFVFLCICLLFSLFIFDDTNDDLALWLATLAFIACFLPYPKQKKLELIYSLGVF